MNRYDLVLHVDKTDGSLSIAFNNAINYAQALHGETYRMALVANAKAVTQLTRDNVAIEELLEKACAAGLEIRVCRNALKANGLELDDLFPQCVVVPAGVVEIVNLQREGYAYIKP